MNFQKVKKDLQNVYDGLAEYWGKDKTLHDWGEVDLFRFSKLVGKGATVLDLGCGSGVQSKILADLGCEVCGLDLSPGMVAQAKKRVPNAEFVVGDMTKMNFIDGTFSGVYARASFLHIPKKIIPKVLKSVHKILKNDGILYLAVKEGEGEKKITDRRHGQKVTRFFSFFKEDELVKFLGKAGFEILKISKFQKHKDSPSWLQILARKN